MSSVATALKAPPTADPALKEWVEELVEQKVFELLGDPDSGLELRPEVEARLKESFDAESAGVNGVPAAEAARRLNLPW